MDYKKISVAEWHRQLAELRQDSQRPFGSRLEASQVSYDLSVLPQYKGVLRPISSREDLVTVASQ